MPQINAGDFRKGTKVILDGDPYDMLECNFVKPGKGQALYKTRLRNILKGTIIDRTYKSGETLEAADIRKGEGQYLYKDAAGFHFMDKESFEQYHLDAEGVGDGGRFLQDGCICSLLYWNDKLIGMTPPNHAIMKVTYTEPAVRGNTTSNITKAATLENGEEVQVPPFVDTGDIIKLDAATGTYIERVRE